MLKKISIENFKAFINPKPARLAPITLIYGPNSSGKSSLVQSLLLMRQTISGQEVGGRNDLIMKGNFVDLGNFSSVLHQHDSKRIMRLGYEFADEILNGAPPKLIRSFDKDQFSGLSLSFKALKSSSRHFIPALQSITFGVENPNRRGFDFTLERPSVIEASNFGLAVDSDDESTDDTLDDYSPEHGLRHGGAFQFSRDLNTDALIDLLRQFHVGQRINRYKPTRDLFESDPNSIEELKLAIYNYRVSRNRWRSIEKSYLPTAIESVNGRDGGRSYWDMLLTDMLGIYDRNLRHSLGRLTYLGPLRTHPARHYLLNGVPGDSVGATGEQTVQILYHDQATGGSDAPLLRRLNACCKQFGIPYHFSLRNIGNAVTGDFIVLYLTDTRTNVRVAPSDVGFGIGQLLPILVEGILANERGLSPRMICVEQPEIHLHPRLQAAMADFFIETSMISKDVKESERAKRRVQWILETHSEALILRLQRKIREKIISPQDICVLYVDPQGERGAAIQELRLDEDGEFMDLWPDGFFVESYSELMGGR